MTFFENLHCPSGVAPGGQCQLNCLTPFVDGGVPRFARALAVHDPCRHRWGGGLSLCEAMLPRMSCGEYESLQGANIL